MLTLRELLTDPVYKKFFITQPEIKPLPRPTPPWRVYIQLQVDGSWRRKDVWKYTEGFNMVKRYLKEGCYDATIQSKGIAYPQPGRYVRLKRNGRPVMIKTSRGEMRPKTLWVPWEPRLEPGDPPHVWCPYCRRPVVIAWFSQHHSFKKGQPFNQGWMRCVICGANEELMTGRR